MVARGRLLYPADLASRGTSVHGLLNAYYWLAVPEFLRNTNEPWRAETSFSPLEQCSGERKAVHVSLKAATTVWDLLNRFSSWDKLLRVTARCHEFISKLKRRIAKPSRPSDTPAVEEQREFGVLSPEQLLAAEHFWVRHVQAHHFHDEIKVLTDKKYISKGSKILKLHPFLDEFGLLRISGRLRNAMIDENSMHPLILPKGSTLSQLLIRDVHARTLHGGTQLVLSTLRQRYWIVNGRVAVKAIISSCVICWKQKPTTSTQLMGDLPAHRVRPARAFLYAGVRLCGPYIAATVKRARC